MSNEMEQYYIPGALDEPWRVGPFTIGEFAGGAGLLAGGFVLQFHFGPMGFLGAFGASIAWVVILKTIKGREGGNVFRNFLYWHLPGVTRSYLYIPKSHLRNFWG
ncbi:hypothetical protein IP70_22220 [alpha proteobacterium AAP38]|nr:hypothetical protein IP70_22220 [alpha proteobacterium AAP38]